MIAIILEFAVLFVLCFERVSEYSVMLRKRKKKGQRQKEKAKILEEQAKEKRTNSKNASAKVRYSRSNTIDEKKKKRLRKLQRKKNKEQLLKDRKAFSLKEFVKWCLIEPKVIRTVRIVMTVLNPLLVMFCIELMNENLLNGAECLDFYMDIAACSSIPIVCCFW